MTDRNLQNEAERYVEDGDYKLSDFGHPNYRDRIDSITILAILVAFTIPLFVEGFRHYADVDILVSYFCGATTLIFYMFYTVDYYDKIWSKWYSLPEDFGFFRIYSLVTGVVVIAAMTVWPQYWYVYLCALFGILTWKKISTKNKYEIAFRKTYPRNDACKTDEEKQELCVFLLAQNMARNFKILGFYASGLVAITLAVLYWLEFTKVSYPVLGQTISCNILFSIVSIFYAGRLSTFWYKKIRVLLDFMVGEVKEGNVKYFLTENRKLL